MRKDPRKRYSATEPFAFKEGMPVLFRGLKPRNVHIKTAYVEHEIKVGERLDVLADAYYGDARLWWVIAQANPAVFFPADLIYATEKTETNLPDIRAGTTILIPAKPEGPE